LFSSELKTRREKKKTNTPIKTIERFLDREAASGNRVPLANKRSKMQDARAAANAQPREGKEEANPIEDMEDGENDDVYDDDVGVDDDKQNSDGRVEGNQHDDDSEGSSDAIFDIGPLPRVRTRARRSRMGHVPPSYMTDALASQTTQDFNRETARALRLSRIDQ